MTGLFRCRGGVTFGARIPYDNASYRRFFLRSKAKPPTAAYGSRPGPKSPLKKTRQTQLRGLPRRFLLALVGVRSDRQCCHDRLVIRGVRKPSPDLLAICDLDDPGSVHPGGIQKMNYRMMRTSSVIYRRSTAADRVPAMATTGCGSEPEGPKTLARPVRSEASPTRPRAPVSHPGRPVAVAAPGTSGEGV